MHCRKTTLQHYNDALVFPSINNAFAHAPPIHRAQLFKKPRFRSTRPTPWRYFAGDTHDHSRTRKESTTMCECCNRDVCGSDEKGPPLKVRRCRCTINTMYSFVRRKKWFNLPHFVEGMCCRVGVHRREVWRRPTHDLKPIGLSMFAPTSRGHLFCTIAASSVLANDSRAEPRMLPVSRAIIVAGRLSGVCVRSIAASPPLLTPMYVDEG